MGMDAHGGEDKSEDIEGTRQRNFAEEGSGEMWLQVSKDLGPRGCFFSQVGRCQSGCGCGIEGHIEAESGSARAVRLVRVPGDQPSGDLKSSLITLV